MNECRYMRHAMHVIKGPGTDQGTFLKLNSSTVSQWVVY